MLLLCVLRKVRETPLIRAAHNGHLSTVRELLARGADANAIDMVRPAPWTWLWEGRPQPCCWKAVRPTEREPFTCLLECRRALHPRREQRGRLVGERST